MVYSQREVEEEMEEEEIEGIEKDESRFIPHE